MDKASCHSLFGVQQKQLSSFSALPMTNVTIVFLPHNCTSVVQPMDQGIIVAFKLRYKSKLLEWVYKFDLDQQQDLKKIVPNVKQTILWSYKVWTDMDPQIIRNCWRKPEILPPDWSADFANEDQREKSRLIKESEDMALLISKLQLGSDEMPFEENVVMEGEDVIEAEYCMSELVDIALGQRIEPTSLNFTTETVNPLDVDERPPPIVKLMDVQQHAQLLATFFMDNSLNFTPANVMTLQGILENFNKIFVANLKWQHQQTIDSFFKST